MVRKKRKRNEYNLFGSNGPETARGKGRKIMTGDGRKNLSTAMNE